MFRLLPGRRPHYGIILLVALSSPLLIWHQSLQALMASDRFMPHATCYSWVPGVVWLHVISDSLIGFAYVAISLTLGYFIYKKKNLPFHWMFLAFGVFIIACGGTHFMEVWTTLWEPVYWLSGGVKAITAIVSVTTALLLPPLIPKALALPSPMELSMMNEKLKNEIDERALAEEDLQKSKALFEGLFESAPDAIVVVDAEGCIVRINTQAETMFGYSRAEVMGQRIEMLIPERFRQRHTSHLAGYVGDPHTRPMGAGLELYGRRRNGEEFPIDINLAPLQIGDDFLALSIIRDITERKRAEEALRLSEAKFSGILSIAADGIISVDESQKITIFNEGAEKIFGYSKAEILGASLDTLIPDRVRFAHKGHIRDFASSAIAARRMGERREIFARRKNGDEFPAEASISKIEIGGEKIFTVVLRDITDQKLIENELREAHSNMEKRVEERTEELVSINKTLQAEMAERKRAEEALRESEERFRLSIEDVKDYAIFTLDPDGLVASWNAGAERIKGYKADEIIGKHHSCFYTEEDIQQGKPAQHLKQAIEEGRSEDEGWRIRKDGSRYWADVVLTALRNAAGKLLGFSKVTRDITERKRAEDLVKASLNEKEILLKEIHHRVKNNLQVISSLLNLQSRYITDKHALETFRDSQGRVKSMALIHEQLYQSKNLAEIDFAKYVQSLANDLLVSYGAPARNIATKIDIKEVFLNIDTAIPCGLIINELVSNSLKYAFHSSNTGKIEVGLCPTDEDRFVLTVKDNGVGFPNDLDFRNTSSLGLRLVNSLTNQLKGNIELSASEGTEFKITFSSLRYKERM